MAVEKSTEPSENDTTLTYFDHFQDIFKMWSTSHGIFERVTLHFAFGGHVLADSCRTGHVHSVLWKVLIETC